MSKIRSDSKGDPYVVVSGAVYRPQKGPHEYPVPQRNWGQGIDTKFKVGDTVVARHKSQTPFCAVYVKPGEIELWTVHSYDTKNPGCITR